MLGNASPMAIDATKWRAIITLTLRLLPARELSVLHNRLADDASRFASREIGWPRAELAFVADFAGRFASREIWWPRAELAFVADFAGRFASREIWWPRAELNHRHTDFQSAALPTELLGRSEKQDPAAWAKLKDFTRSRSTDRTGSRTLTGSRASHRPLHPAPPRPENGPKPARVPAHRLQ